MLTNSCGVLDGVNSSIATPSSKRRSGEINDLSDQFSSTKMKCVKDIPIVQLDDSISQDDLTDKNQTGQVSVSGNNIDTTAVTVLNVKVDEKPDMMKANKSPPQKEQIEDLLRVKQERFKD